MSTGITRPLNADPDDLVAAELTPAGEKTYIILVVDGRAREIEISTEVPDIHRLRNAEPKLQV